MPLDALVPTFFVIAAAGSVAPLLVRSLFYRNLTIMSAEERRRSFDKVVGPTPAEAQDVNWRNPEIQA